MNVVIVNIRRPEVRKAPVEGSKRGVGDIHWDNIALDLGDIEGARSTDLDILYLHKFLAEITTKNRKGS